MHYQLYNTSGVIDVNRSRVAMFFPRQKDGMFAMIDLIEFIAEYSPNSPILKVKYKKLHCKPLTQDGP